MIRLLKLFRAGDDPGICEGIRAAFRDEPDVVIDEDLQAEPEPDRTAAAVFVMTEAALGDPSLARALRRWTDAGLPVIPVLPDLAGYDFSAVPDPLAPLRSLNAAGWKDGDPPGKAVCTAIRQYLGMVPFRRHCKVFISYRRSDGADTAREAHEFLQEKGYRAFLDTRDIEPGEDVQERIETSLDERDFLLLVDSPEAQNSGWVKREIETAFERRVSICVLHLPGDHAFPLPSGMRPIEWSPGSRDRFDRLEKFISEAIASKETFDLRVSRLVRTVAKRLGCDIEETGEKRRMRICKKIDDKDRTLLIEHEDARISLARLYRLHQGYEKKPPPQAAVFVYNGYPLSEWETHAVAWARRDEPLHVMALVEMNNALANFFGS